MSRSGLQPSSKSIDSFGESVRFDPEHHLGADHAPDHRCPCLRRDRTCRLDRSRPCRGSLDDDPETEAPLPTADGRGLRGAALPSANEATREERRFNRLDRDLDGKITRNELLSTRVRDFRKLDVDGNNLLSFEEWAVRTSNRFKGADGNGDRVLTRPEFATTKPKPSQEPKCNCRSDREPAD